MAESSTFPSAPQTIYADIPAGPLIGDLWEDELHTARVTRALIAQVTEVPQITEVTIGANNPGDDVGVTIDGGTVVVTAGADANATALLLETALESAGFLSSILDSVTVNAALVTINFSDSAVHTVVGYSPDATTATPNTTQAAVGQEKLLFGMGVAKRLPITTANNTAVVKPTSTTDAFAGVLLRDHGSNLPPDQISTLGFDPAFLCPGRPYTMAQENLGIVVDYEGTAPVPGDPVYWITTGSMAGWWRIDDGSTPGVSQASTLTITSVADGDLAFNYDGLPDLVFTATGNATNDATSLYGLWLANASYMAITTSIVDNLDGTLTITFADDQVHAFTDNSTGTSTIVQNIGTAAVAGLPATAVLRPEYSWGKPSITTGDPTRAFLRLSA